MYKSIILTILVLGIFTACNKNLPQYTSKEYRNINKDLVLNAAKKVILLSDDRYNVHSYVNSINAVRMIPRYRAYTVDMEINTININAINDNNITLLELRLEQKYDYFDSKIKIIKGKSHQLLWDRIDYILGLNANWPTCIDNAMNANYDGSVCDIIYNQNNHPNKEDIIKMRAFIDKKKLKELIDIDLKEIENIQLPNANSIENKSNLADITLEKMNEDLPISKVINTQLTNEEDKLDNIIEIKEINFEDKN